MIILHKISLYLVTSATLSVINSNYLTLSDYVIQMNSHNMISSCINNYCNNDIKSYLHFSLVIHFNSTKLVNKSVEVHLSTIMMGHGSICFIIFNKYKCIYKETVGT